MVIASKYKGQAFNCFKDMVMNDGLDMFTRGTACRTIGTIIYSIFLVISSEVDPIFERSNHPKNLAFYLIKSITLGLGMVLAYPWFFIADNVCYARFHNS